MLRRPKRSREDAEECFIAEEMLWLLYCWAATSVCSFRLDYGRR
jgi:hypothetical protein